MKSVVVLSLMVLLNVATAQQIPIVDVLQDTHWSLKKVLCQSGLPPIPGFEKGTRYDVHFLTESKFETLISLPKSWSIVKGKYAIGENDQLCLNENYMLTSNAPPYYYDRQTCFTHTVNNNQLTWQFQGGEDCPTTDRQIMIFEKQ